MAQIMVFSREYSVAQVTSLYLTLQLYDDLPVHSSDLRLTQLSE